MAIRASPCGYSPSSRLVVDADFFRYRIARALELRRQVLRLDEVTDAYRVITWKAMTYRWTGGRSFCRHPGHRVFLGRHVALALTSLARVG